MNGGDVCLPCGSMGEVPCPDSGCDDGLVHMVMNGVKTCMMPGRRD